MQCVQAKSGVRKKVLLTGCVAAAVVVIIFCINNFMGMNQKNVLRVYNSGEYIDTELIERFEKEIPVLSKQS